MSLCVCVHVCMCCDVIFLVNPDPARSDCLLVILFEVCDYFWYFDFWFWLRLRSRFVTPSTFISLRLPYININTVRAPALPRFSAKLMCHPVWLATHSYGALLVAAQRCEWYTRRSIVIFQEGLVPSNKLPLAGRRGWICDHPATSDCPIAVIVHFSFCRTRKARGCPLVIAAVV